jgi:hypothetical protein
VSLLAAPFRLSWLLPEGAADAARHGRRCARCAPPRPPHHGPPRGARHLSDGTYTPPLATTLLLLLDGAFGMRVLANGAESAHLLAVLIVDMHEHSNSSRLQ